MLENVGILLCCDFTKSQAVSYKQCNFIFRANSCCLKVPKDIFLTVSNFQNWKKNLFKKYPMYPWFVLYWSHYFIFFLLLLVLLTRMLLQKSWPKYSKVIAKWQMNWRIHWRCRSRKMPILRHWKRSCGSRKASKYFVVIAMYVKNAIFLQYIIFRWLFKRPCLSLYR